MHAGQACRRSRPDDVDGVSGDIERSVGLNIQDDIEWGVESRVVIGDADRGGRGCDDSMPGRCDGMHPSAAVKEDGQKKQTRSTPLAYSHCPIPCSFMFESPTHTSMDMSQLSQIPHDQPDYRVRANRTSSSAFMSYEYQVSSHLAADLSLRSQRARKEVNRNTRTRSTYEPRHTTPDPD